MQLQRPAHAANGSLVGVHCARQRLVVAGAQLAELHQALAGDGEVEAQQHLSIRFARSEGSSQLTSWLPTGTHLWRARHHGCDGRARHQAAQYGCRPSQDGDVTQVAVHGCGGDHELHLPL